MKYTTCPFGIRFFYWNIFYKLMYLVAMLALPAIVVLRGWGSLCATAQSKVWGWKINLQIEIFFHYLVSKIEDHTCQLKCQCQATGECKQSSTSMTMWGGCDLVQSCMWWAKYWSVLLNSSLNFSIWSYWKTSVQVLGPVLMLHDSCTDSFGWTAGNSCLLKNY